MSSILKQYVKWAFFKKACYNLKFASVSQCVFEGFSVLSPPIRAFGEMRDVPSNSYPQGTHRPVQRTHRNTWREEWMRRRRTEWRMARGQCSRCQRTEWSAWAGTILDRSWRKWNWLWALKSIYRKEIRDNLSEGGEAIYHFHAVPRDGEGQKSNLDCHKAVGNMRMLWV